MRHPMILSTGAVACALVAGLAVPGFAAPASPQTGIAATDPSPAGSTAPSTAPSSPQPSPSTSETRRPIWITVDFLPSASVTRGGTISLDLHPSCSGLASSDGFATPDGLVVLPHNDSAVPAPIRTDAGFGQHSVEILCDHGFGFGRAWYTVVAQTTTPPSGGVGTGGGGAARIDTVAP